MRETKVAVQGLQTLEMSRWSQRIAMGTGSCRHTVQLVVL